MSELGDAAREVCEAAADLVDALPLNANPNTRRSREKRDLARVYGFVAPGMLHRHEELHAEGRMLTKHALHIGLGFADLLDSAELKAPALVAVVRAQLEVSGTLNYLFDIRVGAEERCRRFTQWRLGSMCETQLLLLGDPSDPRFERALVSCKGMERDEIDFIETVAAWPVRPTKRRPNGQFARRQAACLQRETPSGAFGDDALPSKTKLTGSVVGGPSMYSLLSGEVHGDRLAVLRTFTEQTPAPADVRRMISGGTSLEVPDIVSLGTQAIYVAVYGLASANGLTPASVRRAGERLLRLVGACHAPEGHDPDHNGFAGCRPRTR